MRFNANGDAIGGVDREIWIEHITVAFGQGARPLDAHRIIYQDEGNRFVTYDRLTGHFELVQGGERGGNVLRADGGVWAAELVGFGVYHARGLLSASAGLLDVGRDGAIYTVPNRNAGTGIAKDGAVVKSGVVAWDFRAYDGAFSWRNDNGVVEHSTYGSALMIPGEPVGGAVWVIVNGVPWIVYHNTRVLRARPFNRSVGVIVHDTTPEQYFNHDAIVLPDGTLKVGWCRGAGERALEYTFTILDLDVASPIDFSIPSVPVPPRPQPVPPKEPVVPFRNELETVQAVHRDYPGLIVRDGAGFTDQVAHRLNRKDGRVVWGRKARNSDGSNPNVDALTYRNDNGTHINVDIIVSSETPQASPGWNDFGGVIGNGFWIPPQSADRDVAGPAPVPTPVPTPIPTPPPDPSPALLREALMAINGVAAVLGQAFMKIDAMEDRIEELLVRTSDAKIQLDDVKARQDRPLTGRVPAFGGNVSLRP